MDSFGSASCEKRFWLQHHVKRSIGRVHNGLLESISREIFKLSSSKPVVKWNPPFHVNITQIDCTHTNEYRNH